MQIRNNFNMEIKPHEWLYIIGAIVIIILIMRGDMTSAIALLENLIPKPK